MARAHPAVRLLAEAGPAIGARDTGRVLGVCTATVQEMARRGDFDAMGVRVLRIGREGSRRATLRFVTADLRRALGLEQPVGDEQSAS